MPANGEGDDVGTDGKGVVVGEGFDPEPPEKTAKMSSDSGLDFDGEAVLLVDTSERKSRNEEALAEGGWCLIERLEENKESSRSSAGGAVEITSVLSGATLEANDGGLPSGGMEPEADGW